MKTNYELRYAASPENVRLYFCQFDKTTVPSFAYTEIIQGAFPICHSREVYFFRFVSAETGILTN